MEMLWNKILATVLCTLAIIIVYTDTSFAIIDKFGSKKYRIICTIWTIMMIIFIIVEVKI